MIRLLTLVAALLAAPASAEIAPPYPSSSSTVVATSQALEPTIRGAMTAFAAKHPEMKMRLVAVGSDVAMAWLYTGKADVAIIGREGSDPELKAFEWAFRTPPRASPLLMGSIAAPGHSPRLVVRVNRANPLRSIRLSELERLLEVRDPPLPWPVLGWNFAHPIELALPDSETGTGQFLRKRLASGRSQLDWRYVQEFDPSGDGIARAVAHNPSMLGLGDGRPYPGTRVIKIIDGAGHEVRLDRTVFAYSQPVPRKGASELLAFLAGKAGQALLVQAPYRSLGSAD